MKIKRVSKIKIHKEIRIEEVMSDKPRFYDGGDDPNICIGTYQSLEKWPKEFFKKFHTIAVDESHGAKSKTLISILKKTIRTAYSRFGVSGTFPPDDSCEILTIQSVLGPKITEVSASELRDKGIISPVEIKALILNHNDSDYQSRLDIIKKGGMGKEALELEKDFIHNSEKRMELIIRLVEKCDKNTLILFHTIEYGQKIFLRLKDKIDKDFFYIDGEVRNKTREEIKSFMEDTSGKTKILIASFGTLSTGVSITSIFNVIFADSFKSEQIIIQSIGRALRLHEDKKTAIIFDLVDVFDSENMKNILFNHFKEREKFYQKRKYPYKVTKINL
jgi:superfamily II DNA or RNA helicase